MAGEAHVTQLLQAWQQGDAGAVDELTRIVYAQLHRLARNAFRSERPGHTLQPTALVHEAFLQLLGAEVDWRSRAHFYAIAARQMRRILVNHAEARRAAKRGGGVPPISLEEAGAIAGESEVALNDIDDALTRLAEFDQRKSSILELHYFGGLTYEEMAEALSLSTTTLHSELRLAKAWLRQQLE